MHRNDILSTKCNSSISLARFRHTIKVASQTDRIITHHRCQPSRIRRDSPAFSISLYSRTPVERSPSPTTIPILYDHILCDGQCFLFVRSLANDHPSDSTNDRVRWDFLSPSQTTTSPTVYFQESRVVVQHPFLFMYYYKHSSNSIDLNLLLFWRRRYNDVLRSTLHRCDVASPPARRHLCSSLGLIQVRLTSRIRGAVVINGSAT